MKLERAARIFIAAVSMLFVASCSHGMFATNPNATTGKISTFVLPSGKTEEEDGARWPGDIAAGPDGALWFTELDGHRIGRIAVSPLGQITEYHIPHTGSDEPKPGSIALGPDGALWFTVPNLDEIGRITTAGQFTEYSVGQNARPSDIVAGSDGALWFTQPAKQQIGRITTSGRVTHYSVPTRQGVSARRRSGLRWCRLVYRARRREDWPNQPLRSHHRIPRKRISKKGSGSVRHRSGVRPCALVYRTGQQEDRTHHDHRPHYGLRGSQRLSDFYCRWPRWRDLVWNDHP